MAKSLFENVLKKIFRKKEDNSVEQSKTTEDFSEQKKEDALKSTDKDLLAREEVYAESRKDSASLLDVKNSSPKSLFKKTSVDLSARYQKYGEDFLNAEIAKALDALILDISNRDVDESWVQDVYETEELLKEQKAAVKKLLKNLPVLEKLQSKVPDVLLAIEKQKAEKKRLDDIKAAEAERLKIEAINSEIQDIIERIGVLSEAKINAKRVDEVWDIKVRLDELPSWASEKILAATKSVFNALLTNARYYEKALKYVDRAKSLVDANNKNLAWANKICDFDFDLSYEVSDLLTKIVDGYDDCLMKANDLLDAEDKRIKKEKAAKEAAKEAARRDEAQKKEQTLQEIAEIRKYLSNVKTGDTITFGSYAPDGSEEKKPIEWIVLEAGNHTFLVTKHVIERHKVITAIDQNLLWTLISDKYSDKEKASFFHWNSSAVRKWLNDKFFEEAFSDAEKSLSGTCAFHTTYTCRTKSKKVDSKVKSSVHVYLPDRKQIGFRAFQKYKKVKALPEINKDELIVEKGLFNAGNVTYLLGDAGVDEAKFKGKRFNKYYVYVCDGKGKIRKFYLNEKPVEYVVSENNGDTLENKDDAVSKAINAFVSEYAATRKLAEKFMPLGIRPMIILDLSE